MIAEIRNSCLFNRHVDIYISLVFNMPRRVFGIWQLRFMSGEWNAFKSHFALMIIQQYLRGYQREIQSERQFLDAISQSAHFERYILRPSYPVSGWVEVFWRFAGNALLLVVCMFFYLHLCFTGQNVIKCKISHPPPKKKRWKQLWKQSREAWKVFITELQTSQRMYEE